MKFIESLELCIKIFNEENKKLLLTLAIILLIILSISPVILFTFLFVFDLNLTGSKLIIVLGIDFIISCILFFCTYIITYFNSYYKDISKGSDSQSISRIIGITVAKLTGVSCLILLVKGIEYVFNLNWNIYLITSIIILLYVMISILYQNSKKNEFNNSIILQKEIKQIEVENQLRECVDDLNETIKTLVQTISNYNKDK